MTGMTPIWHGPLSAAGFAPVLILGVDFLAAGLEAGVPVCVAAPCGAGACADAEMMKHERKIAAMNTLTIGTL